MVKLCLFLFPLLCLSGCSAGVSESYRTLPLNQDIVVQVGEKVGLEGDAPTELEIKSPFLLSADAPAPESFSVEWLKDTATALTARPRYKISFVQLSSENFAPNVIAQSDYRITLRIQRVSP